MTHKTYSSFLAGTCLAIALLTGCGQTNTSVQPEVPQGHEKDDHAHDDHDHDGHDDHACGDHAGDDHADERIEAGPNGGRLITSVEPHLELYVMPDRKVQFTAVNDAGKAIPMVGQRVTAIGGSRAKPTNMAFAPLGTVLVSDKALPDGMDIPVVVNVTTTPGAKAVTERIQLNLRDCPECDNLEYACTCDHAH